MRDQPELVLVCEPGDPARHHPHKSNPVIQYQMLLNDMVERLGLPRTSSMAYDLTVHLLELWSIPLYCWQFLEMLQPKPSPPNLYRQAVTSPGYRTMLRA